MAEEWPAAYERFQAYAQIRKAQPRADLASSEDGKITHQLRVPPPPDPDTARGRGTLQLTFRFLRRGGHVVSFAGGEKGSLLAGRDHLFPPGPYAGVILSNSQVTGYQHEYPIVWFEVVEEEGRKRVKPLPDPERAERVWPNEEISLFRDFLTFRGAHPSTIFDQNIVVSPAIRLTLDNSGKLTRDALTPVEEARLIWRVYKNGELAHTGTARDQLQYTATGEGTYQVLIGITGAHGFMPVSNIAEFPYFLNPSGQTTVLPEDADEDGERDILKGAGTDPTMTVPDATVRVRLELWRSWRYRINRALKQKDDRDLLERLN